MLQTNYKRLILEIFIGCMLVITLIATIILMLMDRNFQIKGILITED